MVHNNSGAIYPNHPLHSTIQVDDRVIYSNDSDLYLLLQKTTGIKNSEKEKINHVTDNRSVKKGLLKSLLIGVAVLSGIGALAAGAYYYVAGRQSFDLSQKNYSSLPVMADLAPGEMGSLSSMKVSHALMDIMNSSHTTETASSPYSYYKKIYGDTVVRNNTLSSVPVITTEVSATKKNPVITKKIIKESVTTAPLSLTSPYMKTVPATMTAYPDTTETAVTEYKHERGRSIYYQSIKKEGSYPLGTKFFNKLTGFCFSDARLIIEQAYTASPNLRCELLSGLVDKIEIIKEDEALLRKKNAYKETLSAEEYDEEILTRRKLTTLYLAAETIINKKDFFTFYEKAIKDYREYSTQELMQREAKIMDYFPIHDAMGEC